MKRSALTRRTPLARTGRLRSRSRVVKRGDKTRDAYLRRRRAAQPFPATVRRSIEARSGGVCEWPACHTRATDLHHRLMRSQGGQHTASNVAHLCRRHHRHIHDHPAESYQTGWLIRGGT